MPEHFQGTGSSPFPLQQSIHRRLDFWAAAFLSVTSQIKVNKKLSARGPFPKAHSFLYLSVPIPSPTIPQPAHPGGPRPLFLHLKHVSAFFYFAQHRDPCGIQQKL